MREIVLDTETTGLEPGEGHRLVEIGCVETINRFATGRSFHVYLNPERDMPPEAFRVHGLSQEFLSDKPLFHSCIDGFLDFIGTSPLIIHNAAFDTKFLNAELLAAGQERLGDERIVDTLMLARRRHPGQRNDLNSLCDRYGIDRSKRVRHGALLDAEILAEVYSELMGGRQATLGLAASGTADESNGQITAKNRIRPAFKSRVTVEEDVSHRAFIATLSESTLWNAILPPPAER